MSRNTLCAQKVSANTKTGPVWTTYRTLTMNKETPDGTCPTECPLLTKCYAACGKVYMNHLLAKKRNDNVAKWMSNVVPHGSLIRHLVSGDFFCNNKLDRTFVRELIAGHKANPKTIGWSYTHGFRRIKHQTLNKLPNLVVNASCETDNDVREALSKGWDAVQVVAQDAPKVTYKDGYKLLVCPAQTTEHLGNKQITCATCKLCAKHNRKDGATGLPVVVGFRYHSPMKGVVQKIVEGLNT